MIKNSLVIFLIFGLSICLCKGSKQKISHDCNEHGPPPFHGTIFINPDIITPADPSTFIHLYYNGKALRTMYDRRVSDWIDLEPYLFPADYDDSLTIEIQVNPEFGSREKAEIVAQKYAVVIGRLTTELRKDVETVWIHRGLEAFGGGNNNLLIHTDWSEKYYEDQGILEETFIHEAAHTSLDSYHANDPDWINAQSTDCNSISDYAKEHPQREDIAESYLPYFAIKYRRQRLPESLIEKIEKAIPNRIEYFDKKTFKMYPVE